MLLSSEHMVGRSNACRLTLPPHFVSSVHALFRWNGADWEIRDLGSLNGTFVNGERLPNGPGLTLGSAAEIVFGEPSETWQLVDVTAPVPAAIPEDGGEPSLLASGTIAIPSVDDPAAVICREQDSWWVELGEVRRAITPGESIVVRGHGWRFECPSQTVSTGISAPRPKRLADAALIFATSVDEEHVQLQVQIDGHTKDLGRRACFYLAMVLYRERASDRRQRVADPGWVDVDALLRMIPDYSSHEHLTVEIHRLRRCFYDLGIEDAGQVVERRRGQLRLGTERALILKAGDPLAPGGAEGSA